MLQAKSQASEITDEERVQSDEWCIPEFDISQGRISQSFLRYFKSRKSQTFDFKKVQDETRREELKRFLAKIFLEQQQSPSTLMDNRWSYELLMNFMNELPFSGSLLQYNEEELHQSYVLFLENRNRCTTSYIHTIRSNQVHHIYLEEGNTPLVIRKFYRFLVDETQEDLPEPEKDVWDIRKLPFKVNVHASRPRYTICFTRIVQPFFRTVAKKYVLERLKMRKLSCVADDIKALNMFSAYLAQYYPHLTSLKELDRALILDYFTYVKSLPYALTTKKSRIGYLRTFLETAHFMDLGDVPDLQLIFREDYRKEVKILPRIIEAGVIKQIKKYLDEVPSFVRRETLLLDAIGMRISDVCNMIA